MPSNDTLTEKHQEQQQQQTSTPLMSSPPSRPSAPNRQSYVCRGVEAEGAGNDGQGEAKEVSILDKAYPLTHFLGHRPRTVREELERGDEGFRPFHLHFHRFITLGWLDPLRGRLQARRARQVEGRKGEEVKRGEEEDEAGFQETWRVKLGWLLSSRLKDVVHSTLAAFVVLICIAFIARSPFWTEYTSPIILGAFGTETVIVFYLYQIPAAQPMAIVLGNTISTIVAVAVQKAFFHYDSYQPGSVLGVNWAAPVVAVITSAGLMQLLGIVHPPGAAVSVLATTSSEVVGVGWQLCAHVILISLLFVAWALLANNVGARRWPNSWGAPFYPTAPSLGELRRHLAKKRNA